MTTYIHIHFYIHIPIRFDVCLNVDFAKLLHNFALFCLELLLIRLYSLYKFLIVSLSGFYAHLYLPSCMLNYSWHIVKYNFIIYYWFSSLRSWSLSQKQKKELVFFYSSSMCSDYHFIPLPRTKSAGAVSGTGTSPTLLRPDKERWGGRYKLLNTQCEIARSCRVCA